MKVIYTPFKPFGYRGLATPWVIVIAEEFKGDQGLLKHELVHVQQFKRLGWLYYMWRYWVLRNKAFIALMEYEAFKKGSGYHDAHIIEILVSRYGVSRALAEEVVSDEQ